MAYFKDFTRIDYQFPDDIKRSYKNLTIRPSAVADVLQDYSNLESYTIQDKDTPETLAYDYYGSAQMHWVIMIVNDVLNIYNDWPLTEIAFNDYILEKYRYQEDSDGISRMLTDDQVTEYVEFVGSTSNGFTSDINLYDSDNSPKILLKPHHFIDEFNNYYTYESYTNTVDAFGRLIDTVELFPISIKEWESNLNDAKRDIVIPSPKIAKKMQQELKDIVNE